MVGDIVWLLAWGMCAGWAVGHTPKMWRTATDLGNRFIVFVWWGMILLYGIYVVMEVAA